MGRVKEAYERQARAQQDNALYLPSTTDTSMPPERLKRAVEDLSTIVQSITDSERKRLLAFFFPGQ